MRFRRVLIAAPSPSELVAFYHDVLELPLARSTNDWPGVQVGETALLFEAAPRGTAPSYHFAFRVPGNQFPEAKRWLQGRASLLCHNGSDEIAWDFWNAMAIYTRDPAGNVLELLSLRRLEETSRPFTAASLLGLAELGLPVHDVVAAVALLNETFGIGLWDRERPAPDAITPVGERGASIIIASLGRPWFLGEASGDHPLDVVLDGAPHGDLRLPDQHTRIRSDA
jgi:catechol 2,3-dioxygenase-like lactoylglutathione lyase family enzyme